MEELEPRLLFSADWAGVFVDADTPDGEAAQVLALDATDGVEATTLAEQRKRSEIVFIDSRTPDHAQLVADLRSGEQSGREFEVVVLEPDRDGILQISEALSGRSDLDAVHIVSHGSDDSLLLGNAVLAADSLDVYSNAVFGWGESLADGADLLIYGCDLASGQDGRTLAARLGDLTGADVAASDDPTGHALLGGDWDLEYRAGTVETAVAFGAEVQETWAGVLATPGITARETVDADSDGQIDQIRITTDQALDDDFTGVTVDVAGYTVTGYSSDVANDNIFYADLTQSGTPDTDVTPTVTVTANTTLSNAGEENLPAEANNPWLDASWLNRTRVTFDNSGQTTNDLDDFPILITLDTTNIPGLDLSATVGADVRFTDAATGAELKYEVESWDAATDTAKIWVTVPTITAGSATDYIHVYYNYDGTATYDQLPADEQAVWDANHEAVWHLNEVQAAGTHVDSTGANDGTRVGNTSGTGQIDGGQLFDGSDDSIDVSSVADNIDGSKGTVSAWFELNDSSQNGSIFTAKLDSQNLIRLLWIDNTSELSLRYTAGSTAERVDISADAAFDEGDGKQHFVALTWDKDAGASGEVKAYLDGGLIATRDTLGTWGGPAITQVTIGDNHTAGDQNFEGMIDEVRFSSVARSADWVAASWLSQKDTPAFTSFGNAESAPANVPATDMAAPVASITRDDADPVLGTSAVFSVNFSEDVTNVTTDDFTLALIGDVTGNILSVGNAGDADASTYTVTVDSITGTGTLGLDFVANDIIDEVSIAANTTPITDEVYTIGLNTAPTLSTFDAVIDSTAEDTEVEITLAELLAQGDEMDVDGTVDAFVVKSVTTGTLRIGTDAISATAWVATTNDTIDATNHAYWTPAQDANGTLNVFQVVAKDDMGAESVGNVQAQVSVSAVNDPSTIVGTATGQAVTDKTTLDPFSGVTVGDVDNPAQTLTVVITLDAAAKGQLTNLGGFAEAPAGTYTFSGTAAAATTALNAMTFDPTENRVAPGLTETTTFTLSVDDGSGPVVDANTTVISTSVEDTPTIVGTAVGQAVTDQTTVDPFSGVTVGDLDNPAQTLTVVVTLDAAAKGQLTNLGGFAEAPAGTYTFSGTAAAATTALNAMTFDPTENRVAPGLTETTTFTLSVDDGSGPVVDANTTVISTSVNDPSTIVGTATGQVVTDQTTVDPFSGVTVGDLDNPAQTLTVVVTLDAAAKGQLANLGGFAEAPAGTYTFSGTAAAATTALNAMTFDPTENRVAPGLTETTTFTLSVDDGSGPVVDANTTVRRSVTWTTRRRHSLWSSLWTPPRRAN